MFSVESLRESPINGVLYLVQNRTMLQFVQDLEQKIDGAIIAKVKRERERRMFYLKMWGT